MNSTQDLPELLRAYFTERADTTDSSRLLEGVVAVAATTRPRPSWLARLLGPAPFEGTSRDTGQKPGRVVFLPRVRLSTLGWIALVVTLIGALVALAVFGGPRPRPIF